MQAHTPIWHGALNCSCFVSLQMVRRARSTGRASSTRHGTRVSVTWRPSGCCRLPLSCETSPSRRPTSSCWRPTERACASYCSVPTVTSSHSDSLDLTRWATWLLRLVRGFHSGLGRVKTVQCQNTLPNITIMTLKNPTFLKTNVRDLGQFSNEVRVKCRCGEEDLFQNIGYCDRVNCLSVGIISISNSLN